MKNFQYLNDTVAELVRLSRPCELRKCRDNLNVDIVTVTLSHELYLVTYVLPVVSLDM